MGNFAVAVDGPAGTGKSTVVKLIAHKFGLKYIDTGAMYRTVALKVIKEGLNTKLKEDVASILDNLDMQVSFDENGQVIYLDGENVNNKIRTSEVSAGSSNVAVIPEVRIKLVEVQRELAVRFNVAMDGRDIGTYVLPNAEVKVYLTADIEERAKRRYNELIQKGYKADYEEVKKSIEERDRQDSSREFAPLKPAEDDVIIDTTNMTIDEVVSRISSLIETKINK